jgi:hypothetical protein
LDANTNKIHEDIINLKDIERYKSRNRDKQPKEDTRILQTMVETITQYDRLIGHYSCRFDLPFVRTRAVICNVAFPFYGELYQADTWFGKCNKEFGGRNEKRSFESSY